MVRVIDVTLLDFQEYLKPLVNYYLFESPPALRPRQELSKPYSKWSISRKYIRDIIWILWSKKKQD